MSPLSNVLFVIALVCTGLLGFIAGHNIPEPPKEVILDIQPIVHDVCVTVGMEFKCHNVPLYPGLFTIADEQITAIMPDGSVFYKSRVEYIGPCTQDCEIGK
jgi:hypothetical protein